MKIKLFFLLLLSCFTISANADYYSYGSTYQVGTWTNDISITPSEAIASCLGGYGAPFSRCGSAETLDAITVRALSISDDDTKLVLAVIDTIGIGDSVIAEIKDTVFNLTDGDISKESIQVVATHTHAGPDMQGLWGGIDPAYRGRIIRKAALSIVLANYTAVDAEISAVVVEDGAKVRNRRGWDDADSDIAVLDIKEKHGHRRIATLVNMSAHPTILDESNFGYSAGYIHFVRKKLEKRLGGNSIFINGRLGDVAPLTNGEATYEQVRKYGRRIARKVIRNIDHAEPLSGDFSLETHAFSHPITNIPVIGAVQAGLLDLEIDQNFNVNTQFSVMEFGSDLTAILFPGEILTRLAEPIISEIDSPYKFFFGLADDSLGYFIPSDEFGQIPGRDTEERASLDINAGDAIQSAILDAID